MSTHTMTKVGVVRNSCNKQVMYSIIRLEKEYAQLGLEIKACIEHGLTAFLSSFRDEHKRIEAEIRTLLDALRTNISTL